MCHCAFAHIHEWPHNIVGIFCISSHVWHDVKNHALSRRNGPFTSKWPIRTTYWLFESKWMSRIDNHITWSSNQQTTKIIWSTHRLTAKSFEAHIDWQPNRLNLKSIDNQNHLNLKSDDNQIIWLSTRLNLTSIDFRTNWTPHTPFL